MKKPLVLLLTVAASMPFVACTTTDPTQNTVFHRAEDSPRTGATQRSRYGAGGTHSPSEQGATTNQQNPDGSPIVMPRARFVL